MTKTVRVLTKARDAIARDWFGREGRNSYQVCAYIALGDASGGVGHLMRPACNVFREVIGEDNIIGWNDAPGRTQAEGVAAFDKAIEAAS